MTDDVDIRVRLRDAAAAAAGLTKVKGAVTSVGDAADRVSAKARTMGGAIEAAGLRGSGALSALGRSARWGALGVGALAGAGVKWGLGFNAQIESGRLRLGLFTDDVDSLQAAISAVDMGSQFNLAPLTDVTALLGNAGRSASKLPQDLQAIANAAAASGRGESALQGIGIALSQIQSKGRLSQEEINQLNEAGAPGAQAIIQKAFNLTAKEVQNLGNAHLDAGKALDALTAAWTSGKMAEAAKAQTKTLGGQWSLFTGNAQKGAGALTSGLAKGLERDVLPAANRAAGAITNIFNDDKLAPAEKLRRARQVINRELGPVWDDIEHGIEGLHLDQKLGGALKAALPAMAHAATDIAPDVAEAFVVAWLHSGPWVQLATLAALGKKGNDVRNYLRQSKGGGLLGTSTVGEMVVTAGTVIVNGGLGGPAAKTARAAEGAAVAAKGGSRAAAALGVAKRGAKFAGKVAAPLVALSTLDDILSGKNVVNAVDDNVFFGLGQALSRARNNAPADRAVAQSNRVDISTFGAGRHGAPVTVQNQVTVKIGDRTIPRAATIENERAKARRG